MKKVKENEKERPWAKTGGNTPCSKCGKEVYKEKNWFKNKRSKAYCSHLCSYGYAIKPTDEIILDAFIKEKLTMKEISEKYHAHRIKVKKILIAAGLEKQIYIRWKQKIGETTKKHRKYQIFPKTDTSIEVKIQNFLKQLNIEFFTHQYMKIENGYQCDILIPSMKLVIECDGNYWHGNPNMYSEKQLSEKQKEQQIKDKLRTDQMLQKGFKVLRIWENEIKLMNVNKFKGKLEEIND